MTVSRTGSAPTSMGEALVGNTIFRPLIDGIFGGKDEGISVGVGSRPPSEIQRRPSQGLDQGR